MIKQVLRYGTRQLIVRDLRKSFRRICVVGRCPELPEDRPVVAYANHNYYHDGHLLWLLANRAFSRPLIVWMQEWDRFPFFGTVGALPFPAGDPVRRAMTVRETIRRFEERPAPLFGYFPGSELVPPESEPPLIDERTIGRISRMMPAASWIPVAIHVTSWGERRPTALIGVGESHDAPAGDEQRRLSNLIALLRSDVPPVSRTLMEGSKGPDERVSLGWTRHLLKI